MTTIKHRHNYRVVGIHRELVPPCSPVDRVWSCEATKEVVESHGLSKPMPHRSRHLRSIARMPPGMSWDGSPQAAEIGMSSLINHRCFSLAGIAHGLAAAFLFTNKLATKAIRELSQLRRFTCDSPEIRLLECGRPAGFAAQQGHSAPRVPRIISATVVTIDAAPEAALPSSRTAGAF